MDQTESSVYYPEEFSVPNFLLTEFEPLFPEDEKSEEPKKGRVKLIASQRLVQEQKDHINFLSDKVLPEMLNVLARILLKKPQQNSITLSILEWLIINYSKDHSLQYKVGTHDFDLHKSYVTNLNTFGRPYFDVYSRNQRILVVYISESSPIPLGEDQSELYWTGKQLCGARIVSGEKHNYIITSIGQVNLFRWAIQNKIVQYCVENLDDIKLHEKTRKERPKIKRKQTKTTKSKKKRKSAPKGDGTAICSFGLGTIDIDFSSGATPIVTTFVKQG